MSQADANGGRLPDPAERGGLDISRVVLRKIAEHAADEVAAGARVRRRIAGVGLGEHGASAQLSGPDQELRVRLEVVLHYPSPVRTTVREMRERVGSELDRLAGCQVRTVDVTVAAMVPAARPRRVG
ncbi:Asp23/Gls24 family envelope stress response protein [Saccharopolyspora taberi]|uniref:Asp23/Gls24 family envelope stress response protein n=1 Tax=Saccharopolyspora taberi TaxID=60895 RepID=A0ABN3VFT3_9PSEU